jgi:hypothetical protein
MDWQKRFWSAKLGCLGGGEEKRLSTDAGAIMLDRSYGEIEMPSLCLDVRG